MTFRSLFVGAAALALFAMPAFAQDYVGGAIKTVAMDGKEVLTNAAGMTLYTFDNDTMPNVTTCYEQCAINWPPALADAAAMPEGDFTLVDRTDGTKMWAYKGKPLYLWKDDTAPGQATGDGRGGVWHIAVAE